MLRVADRELEHVLEPPRAEIAQEQQPAAERPGDARGENARARDEPVAERTEALDRRGGRRDPLRAQDERLAALGAPEDRGKIPAGAVQVRLDDLEGEAGGDRRVEGVPAALEHCHPCGGGEPVSRRDHPEGAPQLRSRRESGHHARTLRCSGLS